MSQEANLYDSYELTPRYWFCGQWLKRTQGYPNWHPRLLRRGSVWFKGGVWESFSSAANTSKIYIPYEHYAFSKGLDDWVDRHQRYSTRDASDYFTHLSSNSHKPENLRKHNLRFAAARLWLLKPFLRFIHKYIVQLGFTEGWQSLIFCLLMFFYDFMTLVKIIQSKRRILGLPL